MVMIATSSRASGCWDSLGCPCGIFFERDPWKSTFFRYKTGSISVTGSLAAARTRVYDTNPPLVGLVGLDFSDYRRYAWFSCRSTQDRKRGQGNTRGAPGLQCGAYIRTSHPTRAVRRSSRLC